MIRVGVAGWSYDDWKALVYPSEPPRGFDPLPYLAAYVDVIEINSTFYHPPRPGVAKKWAKRVREREHFRFTAKLWRRFTHEREAWARDDEKRVYDGFAPLMDAGRLGAVLIQFPWSFKRTPENREWLDDVVEAFDRFPLVVEVRHESWNVAEFYHEVAERGVGFVNIDQPLFANSIEPSARASAGVAYVRLHGRNYQDWFRKGAGRDERYDYLYPPDELEPWVERTRELEQDVASDEVYFIANNHYRGQAVVNALMAKSMLEGEEVPAPPDLWMEFSEALKPYARAEEIALPQVEAGDGS